MLSADTGLCAPQAETLAFRTDSYKEGRKTSWEGPFRRAIRPERAGRYWDPPISKKNHQVNRVRKQADDERVSDFLEVENEAILFKLRRGPWLG